MGLGVFVIANDFTALSVAIPEIESDLDTNLNQSQWVINGYASCSVSSSSPVDVWPTSSVAGGSS